MEDKHLELEKLKFKYEYLRDIETQRRIFSFFLLGILGGTGISFFFGKNLLFTIIAAVLFLFTLFNWVLDTNRIKKEMDNIWNKVNNI